MITHMCQCRLLGLPTLPWGGPMWVSSMMKPLSNFCTLGRVCLMGTLLLPGSSAAATAHAQQFVRTSCKHGNLCSHRHAH